MPFAIRYKDPKLGIRYYSQTIESLHSTEGIKEIVLLTDGRDPDEVDVSRTLVEAENKLYSIVLRYPEALHLKVVEFPEPEENDD